MGETYSLRMASFLTIKRRNLAREPILAASGFRPSVQGGSVEVVSEEANPRSVTFLSGLNNSNGSRPRQSSGVERRRERLSRKGEWDERKGKKKRLGTRDPWCREAARYNIQILGLSGPGAILLYMPG